MRKQILGLVILGASGITQAQFQVNPQMGLTYQHLTPTDKGVTYRAGMGWQLGTDLRFGDRLFFQPGVYLGRNVTAVQTTGSDNLTVEDDLIRTSLSLRALAGYRLVDSYQFDLRFFAGPSYDVLLSVDNKDDKITWNEGDFNKGSFNVVAGLGFDMGHFTLAPTATFGLSRVFTDAGQLSDISSRYLTYGLTIGVNFGDDD
ncbi:MAG: PorT family protein [Flavobacteriales bacterium]|nr:PorT family protein [Flavobacteriales bacterium]